MFHLNRFRLFIHCSAKEPTNLLRLIGCKFKNITCKSKNLSLDKSPKKKSKKAKANLTLHMLFKYLYAVKTLLSTHKPEVGLEVDLKFEEALTNHAREASGTEETRTTRLTIIHSIRKFFYVFQVSLFCLWNGTSPAGLTSRNPRG